MGAKLDKNLNKFNSPSPNRYNIPSKVSKKNPFYTDCNIFSLLNHQVKQWVRKQKLQKTVQLMCQAQELMAKRRVTPI
jgi:hypothetical protein